MKVVKFEVKGQNVSNIKIGNIVNINTYHKDANDDNVWKKFEDIFDDDKDWEVVDINVINEKYTWVKLQRTTPYYDRNGNVSYYPKKRIVFDKDGVSKSQYSSSAPRYSFKYVISNIKES